MNLRRRELLSAAVGFLVAAAALAIGAYFWGGEVEDRIVERIGIEGGRVVDQDPPVARSEPRLPGSLPVAPALGAGGGVRETPDEATGGAPAPTASQPNGSWKGVAPGKGGSDPEPPPDPGDAPAASQPLPTATNPPPSAGTPPPTATPAPERGPVGAALEEVGSTVGGVLKGAHGTECQLLNRC